MGFGPITGSILFTQDEPTKSAHFHELARATPDRSGQPRVPGHVPYIMSSRKRGEWTATEQLGKIRTIRVPGLIMRSESPTSGEMPGKHSRSSRQLFFTQGEVEGVKFVGGAEWLKPKKACNRITTVCTCRKTIRPC